LMFKPLSMTTASLEKQLRHMDTPIVGRIVNDYFLIDLRTVLEGEDEIILQAFRKIFM